MAVSGGSRRRTGLAPVLAALVAVACAFCPVGARAQQTQQLFSLGPTLGQQSTTTADVRAGFTHTSNAQMVNTGGNSDTIASVGVDLNAQRAGPMLTLLGQGSMDYIDYLNGTYRSLPLGNLTGLALWGKTSDLFQFAVKDNFSQSSTDAFAAATPNTLENVNVVTAGPALNVHLDASTRVSLMGIYTRTTYQSSDLDSQSYTGGLAVTRRLSSLSSVSLNLSDQDTSYQDSTVNPGFHLKSATVSYSAGGRRTALTVDAGYSEVDQLNQPDKGFTAHINGQRILSGASTVYVDARQDFVTLSLIHI